MDLIKLLNHHWYKFVVFVVVVVVVVVVVIVIVIAVLLLVSEIALHKQISFLLYTYKRSHSHCPQITKYYISVFM